MAFRLIAFSVYSFPEASRRKINMQIPGVLVAWCKAEMKAHSQPVQTRLNCEALTGTEPNTP